MGCGRTDWDPLPRAVDPVTQKSSLFKLLSSEIPAQQARLCQHYGHSAGA